jgi:hypothetical protein
MRSLARMVAEELKPVVPVERAYEVSTLLRKSLSARQTHEALTADCPDGRI